jgi:hypothetical protein
MKRRLALVRVGDWKCSHSFSSPACICRTACCPPSRSCRWRMERFSLWTAAWRAFVRRDLRVCGAARATCWSSVHPSLARETETVWRTLEIVASTSSDRSVVGQSTTSRTGGEVACVRCIRLASRVLRPISFFPIRPNEGHIHHPLPQRAGCCPDTLARYHDAQVICARVCMLTLRRVCVRCMLCLRDHGCAAAATPDALVLRDQRAVGGCRGRRRRRRGLCS